MADLAPYIFQQYFEDDGTPLNAGTITAYEAGTLNLKDTFTTAAGDTANANPFTLGADGRTTFYLENGSYDFVIKDSAGNTLDTKEDITGSSGSGSNSSQSVESIAGLKALPSGSSDYVDVGGYYLNGDDGGGRFFWDSTNSTADNGGTIISPDSAPGTGRWVRIYDGVLHVKWFGATGDGTTNDTSFVSSAFSLSHSESQDLYFSDGTYLLDSVLTANGSSKIIMGVGAQFTSSGSVTITFNGIFECGLHQCFAGSTTGSFGDGAVEHVLPEWWGAKADGDDLGVATGTDCTAAFNSALATSFTSVKLARGNYMISGQITLLEDQSITGEGHDITEVYADPTGSSTYSLFKMVDQGSVGQERVNRNLSLTGFSINGNDNNIAGGTTINIEIENAVYCSFTDMEFKQSEGNNMVIEGSSNFFFTNCLWRDGNESQLTLIDSTNMTLGNSNTIRVGSKWGVYFPNDEDACDNITLSCRFAGNPYGAIMCEGNNTTHAVVLGASFLNGGSNTYDGISGDDSTVIKVESGSADGWAILGCFFERAFGKVIDINSDHAIINGNQIDSCRRTAIVVRGISSSVTDNKITDAGYLTDDTYYGIQILGNLCQVKGNNITYLNDVGGGGEKIKYGIFADTGSNNSTISDNYIGSDAYATQAIYSSVSSVSNYKNSGGAKELTVISVGMTGSQTNITAATSTPIDFDDENIDKQSEWALDGGDSIYKFTASVDGWYRVNAVVHLENLDAGITDAYARFRVFNSSDVEQRNISFFAEAESVNVAQTLTVNGFIEMAATDYGYVDVYLTGSGNTTDIRDSSYVNIERVDV